MNILLTNDDGYFSPGIKLLKEVILGLGHHCTIVAPQNQKSGVSSALTLFEPIFLYENSHTSQSKEYYISGTPVDCVKVALNQLLEKKPDFLISGINQGANIGINVIYSGTVGAAFEGIFSEIPSIAISLNANEPEKYKLIQPILKKLLKMMLSEKLGIDCVWNVNIPAIPSKSIKGVRMTKLSTTYYRDSYEHRKDLRGRSYFWLGENIEIELKTKEERLSDSVALKEGYISITPLTFDMTHRTCLKKDFFKTW